MKYCLWLDWEDLLGSLWLSGCCSTEFMGIDVEIWKWEGVWMNKVKRVSKTEGKGANEEKILIASAPRQRGSCPLADQPWDETTRHDTHQHLSSSTLRPTTTPQPQRLSTYLKYIIYTGRRGVQIVDRRRRLGWTDLWYFAVSIASACFFRCKKCWVLLWVDLLN